MRKCKSCNERFTPINTLQKFCFSSACVGAWILSLKETQWKNKKKKMISNLMTTSDYLKSAQTPFNKYIRLRDIDLPCISCGVTTGQFQAGHYFSSGGHSAVRYNEDNCHKQCAKCNMFLSGNLIPYRKALINKIGEQRFSELEEIANNKADWSKEELISIRKKYEKKLKKN